MNIWENLASLQSAAQLPAGCPFKFHCVGHLELVSKSTAFIEDDPAASCGGCARYAV